MDTKLEKWTMWFKKIEIEISELVLFKDVFWSVQDLIKKNETIQHPNIFYRYLGDTYVSHMLMGIRRQIKKDQQSISFHRLLDELSRSPEIISRQYFTSLYKGPISEEWRQADEDFDKFCGDTPEHVSKDIVLQDIKELISYAKRCEGFADRVIAHADQKSPKYPITFGDIDECISCMDKLVCKYKLIFYAIGLKSLMPTYQYDWLEIFDEPWRKPVKN